MIKAAAFVCRTPVLRPIGPPCVELFVHRHEFPHHINPLAARQKRFHTISLGWCVADDFQKLLVGPDIFLMRCNVQVANDNRRTILFCILPSTPFDHLVEEIELVGELVIGFNVRHIATRRDIEVVDGHAAFECCGHMTGVPLLTPIHMVVALYRQA